MSEFLVKAELSQANDREEQTAGSDNNPVASDQRAAATACRSSAKQRMLIHLKCTFEK